ncbi:hypothetical protein [Holdemanella sp.]|uniref:hypothetical protein n=1 Tax=Holdemanella sp. TaxID=1971762 RepID=UPI0027BA82E6|nr:hypothetical protein [Holdemanella sp.]
MLVVWYPLFEHPCCNAKGDVYAKERILRVDDGTLEDVLYAILQFIEEFTGMVTVKFFENKNGKLYDKLYDTIDVPMSGDLLKKFDESQLESYVSGIKLIRYINDEEHIDIQINVIKGIYDSNILRDLVKS